MLSFLILIDYIESHGQLHIPKSYKNYLVAIFYGHCSVFSSSLNQLAHQLKVQM